MTNSNVNKDLEMLGDQKLFNFKKEGLIREKT